MKHCSLSIQQQFNLIVWFDSPLSDYCKIFFLFYYYFFWYSGAPNNKLISMVVSDLCQITSACNSCKDSLIQHKMFMEDPLKQEDKYWCQSLKCNLFSIILEKIPHTTQPENGNIKCKSLLRLSQKYSQNNSSGRNYSKPKQV